MGMALRDCMRLLVSEKRRNRQYPQKRAGTDVEIYNGVKDIPGVKIYGDYSQKERCAIVTLNIGDYDSSEVSDELLMEYNISTRSGGHCAPLMHKALGTVEQGAVRFSFSHYNTEEEVDAAVRAIHELAEEP